MGYSIAWLAVECTDPDAALADLKLRRIGEHAYFAEEALTSAALPGGQFLIVADTCDHRIIEPDTLASLSVKYSVVACSIEEHVMFSSAEQWIGGKRLWRIEHQAEDSPIHLATAGSLPASFSSIAAKQKAAQEAAGGEDADVDLYFEIPLLVAKGITGFKHDDVIDGIDYDRFDVLEA